MMSTCKLLVGWDTSLHYQKFQFRLKLQLKDKIEDYDIMNILTWWVCFSISTIQQKVMLITTTS